MKKLCSTVVLTSFVFLVACEYVAIGLIGAGVGLGAYKYSEGNLTRTYAEGYDMTWKAAKWAVSDFELKEEEKGQFDGEIMAQAKDDTKVSIEIKSIEDNITRVGVKFGYFGDRRRSEIVHDRIAKSLSP